MYIRVNVITGAKKESFQAAGENRFDVAVKEKPERNLANKRVLELVAIHFDVKPKEVRIINGHHSPSKMLSVR
ncbi:MAG: DUF167 domain-containing protein [Patescibacteria group bacterium]